VAPLANRAWLETDEGGRLLLDGTTSLDRSQTLHPHGFPHDKISRRHALIHAQEGGEFSRSSSAPPARAISFRILRSPQCPAVTN